MPNLTQLTLTDGTNPLVFKPQSTRADNTIAQFHSRDPAAPENTNSLSVQSREQANSAHRTVGRLTLPVIRVVDGLSQAVDSIIVEVNVRGPAIASENELSAALAYGKSLMDSDILSATTVNREGFW